MRVSGSCLKCRNEVGCGLQMVDGGLSFTTKTTTLLTLPRGPKKIKLVVVVDAVGRAVAPLTPTHRVSGFVVKAVFCKRSSPSTEADSSAADVVGYDCAGDHKKACTQGLSASGEFVQVSSSSSKSTTLPGQDRLAGGSNFSIPLRWNACPSATQKFSYGLHK